MKAITNEHLALGIPCSFPFVPASFLYSFLQMDRPDFTLIHADNGPIDTLRNDIVAKAQIMGATRLIMMDVDMIYHPKTVTTLLEHKTPLVGALCFRRYPPFDSIMLRVEGDRYDSVDTWEEGEIVDVDATGAGCLMFDMQLFKDLDERAEVSIAQFETLQPTDSELALMSLETRTYIKGLQERCVHPEQPGVYFKFEKIAETGMTIGEDIGFCQRVKEAGYKIFVDTTVPADHLTTMAVNRATHQLYRAMKVGQAQKGAALGFLEEAV